MSTQPISSTGLQSTTGVLQITGLASGLNTNAIIQALLAPQQLQIANIKTQESVFKALDTQLTTIQSSLNALALSAQSLSDPGLFSPTQTATSADTSVLGAAMTNSTGVGAVSGSYQVVVNNLATAGQRTYAFTSPTSAADTITIDGTSLTIPVGATAQSVADQINSGGYDVWGTVNQSGQLVLSDRATGNNATYISVSDPEGSLTEQKKLAVPGTNASFTVNGTAGTSASNTVTTAISGVTLTLNAPSATGSSVTVNVSSPAPDAKAIVAAVNSFVSAYNTAVGQINTQITTQPAAGQTTQGSLFGDEDLTDLLGNMRQTIYAPGAGLPSGMAALSDIGITTGAPVASGSSTQTSLEGQLTVDTSALTTAIQNNPLGVQQILQSWSSSFYSIVNAEAEPGGSLDARIQGNTSEISGMDDRLTTLNEMMANRQADLTKEYAALESSLSQSQAQGNWLMSQIAQLP